MLLSTTDAGPLVDAPLPVARYFRQVLPNDRRKIASAVVEQEGEFRLSANWWRPFGAEQRFTMDPASFVWDAQIRLAPLLNVTVRDAYLEGAGSMRASLLGWPFVLQQDRPELNTGALQRYLAEAIWFPTALLPGCGVTWSSIDDRTALASIRDGSASAALRFHFNAAGEVVKISTPARHRTVKGGYVATPWLVRCGDYQEADGIWTPRQAEVEWLLPEGPYTYWRGRIVDVRYRFASTPSTRVDESARKPKGETSWTPRAANRA